MSKFCPNLPWNAVPGYIYCGLLEYFQHFWYLILSIFCYRNRDNVEREVTELIETKYLLESNRDITKEDDKYYGFITYSNRLMFDTFIEFLREKKGSNLNVCLTAFVHTGYNRILKWTQCNEYIIDFNDDFSLNDKYLDENKISKCDVILITHCFGAPFIDFKRLIDIGIKYNIAIYEDCVQIGYMGSSPFYGSKYSTIRSWSGGQDKIPISFGGGIGFVKSKQLRDELNIFIRNKYPLDTKWQRFRHLCGKLPLILIYRNIIHFAWICAYFIAYLIYGKQLHETTMFVRKNWGGFVHGRTQYSKQASIAQLLSIKHAISRHYHNEYKHELHKRQYFVSMCIKHLGEKQTDFHFPWKAAVDYEKSSNFYYHFRVKEKESALKMLADNNFPTLPCQAWYVDKEKAPNAYKIKEQMLILPNGAGLKDYQIENMARCFKQGK